MPNRYQCFAYSNLGEILIYFRIGRQTWLFLRKSCWFIPFSASFNGCLMNQLQSSHPNMLKIVGVSDESAKSHFVLFHGSKQPPLFSIWSASIQLNELVTSEQKMQSLIAKALGTDLNTSILLSMKAVSCLIDLNSNIHLP